MKTRILSFALLAVIFAAFGVAAMAQDVAREDTVIFDIDGASGTIANYDNFNWMLPDNRRNAGYHQAVSEPLFILSYETGEIMPWLGLSMTSNETLDVWTLNLRQGVEWADGEAFDADDVMFTMNLLLHPENGGFNNAAALQTWVESVEQADSHTVVYNLKQPNPRFQLDHFSVRIWGGINILPEHVWADKDPFTYRFYDPEAGYPLGTGAYRLTAANETTWIYDRNDDWWGAKTGDFKLPEPKRAIWVVTGNDQIRASLTANNELDSIMDVTLGAFEAMQAANPNVTAWSDGMPFVWLGPCSRQLSFQNTAEPWDNPDLRWAVNYAIDREEIIAIAYEGVTVPSRSFYPEYGAMFPFIDAIEAAGMAMSSTADQDAAAALLEANGYARNDDGRWVDGDGNALTLTIQAHEGFIEKRRIASVVVEQLNAFGIDARSAVVAGATWDENKRFGNYEATLDWDSCGSINEPWATLDRYSSRHYVPVGERSSGNNHARWSGPNNDAYSAIVAELGSLPLGDPQIMDMVVEAYRYFYEDLPIIPLNQATKLVPFNSTYWEGWPSSENNYNHPATWWHSVHQIFQHLTRADG